MFNDCTFMGRITNDIELKTTANGKELINFSIAMNEKYNGVDHPTFVNCSAFGKTAKFIHDFFSKGRSILVKGKASNYSKEIGGEKVNLTSFTVFNASFTGEKKQDDNGQASPAVDKDFASDDIPF